MPSRAIGSGAAALPLLAQGQPTWRPAVRGGNLCQNRHPSRLCCSSQYYKRPSTNHGLPWLRCGQKFVTASSSPERHVPKGPEPKRPAPAAGQGPGSLLFDRLRCLALVDGAGPLVCWPANRHAADGHRWILEKGTCASIDCLPVAVGRSKRGSGTGRTGGSLFAAVAVEQRWCWRRMRRCVWFIRVTEFGVIPIQYHEQRW
jgi:hypothetical protein